MASDYAWRHHHSTRTILHCRALCLSTKFVCRYLSVGLISEFIKVKYLDRFVRLNFAMRQVGLDAQIYEFQNYKFVHLSNFLMNFESNLKIL